MFRQLATEIQRGLEERAAMRDREIALTQLLADSELCLASETSSAVPPPSSY